jgi:signal transduction histidine kinase
MMPVEFRAEMAYNQSSQIRKFMKAIEFSPDEQSTAFSQDPRTLNDVFLEILPVIFHKLKNKLTPVIGYTQILKSRAADDFTMERLKKIEDNAVELTASLNILKDYFKIGTTPLKPGNINRIAQNLKPGWQKTAAEGKVDFLFDLDPRLPAVALHSGQIKLLLRNLATNAMAALQMKTALRKEILLATRLEGGQVKLLVRDNGVGMKQDELDNIWAPFYAKFKNGVGLGLVICERIIANHGASCQVRSCFGEFTEFEVVFPKPEKPLKKRTASAGKGHAKEN